MPPEYVFGIFGMELRVSFFVLTKSTQEEQFSSMYRGRLVISFWFFYWCQIVISSSTGTQDVSEGILNTTEYSSFEFTV